MRSIGLFSSDVILPVVLGLSVLAAPSSAPAQVDCVQAELTRLGYQPGVADGLLGPRTIEAAQTFQELAGLDLPDLTDATAAQWCAALRDHTQGGITEAPSAEALALRAARLLPGDVLSNFLSLDVARRGELCLAQGSAARLAELEPPQRIEGFSSRMRQGDVFDSEWVPGARDTEDFAGALGNLAIRALATDDDTLRGQLLDELQRWAEAGAFLDTYPCNLPDPACTQWTVADGTDRSRDKDWEFAMDNANSIIRSYFVALADFEIEARAHQHAAIAAWIAALGEMQKPADALPIVWFYGQVFWPSIVTDYATGRDDSARRSLQWLADELVGLALAEDGSVPNGTTRGDRALWYHYYALSMIVPSMEMMRAAGIEIPPEAEARLHRAVALFVAALDDPDTLDPWASVRWNSTYDGTQDFDFGGWTTSRGGGSWLHIYPYRYPDRPEAAALRARVPLTAPTAWQDNYFGPGIGCLYNAAAEFRDGLAEDRLVGSGVAFSGGTQIESSAVVEAERVRVWERHVEASFVEYEVSLQGVEIDGQDTFLPQFSIYTDFFGGRETIENLSLFRLVLPQGAFRDPESREADFLACEDVSASTGWNGRVFVRFLIGSEADLNSCVLERLGPNDLRVWPAVVNTLGDLLAQADGEAAARAAEIHAYAAN